MASCTRVRVRLGGWRRLGRDQRGCGFPSWPCGRRLGNLGLRVREERPNILSPGQARRPSVHDGSCAVLVVVYACHVM